MEEWRRRYESLQKRYKLPDFSNLDKEFDVGPLETEFLLRYLRKRISEFLDSYLGILEDVLHPESNVSGLYECRIFTEEEKEAVFEIYRRLMRILRSSVVSSLVNTELEEANFIKDSYKEWPEIKKQMLPLMRKLTCSWEKETSTKEDLGYLG